MIPLLRRGKPRSSPLGFLLTTVFIDVAGYGLVIPLLPFYARQYSADAALVGLLASLYAAMQLLGGPLLGGISDRAGRRPVMISCLLVVSLAYALLGFSGSLAMLIAAVALAGGASGTLATAQAYVADCTSPEERARGLGLIGAACGLGLISGPALGGLLSLHALATPAFAACGLALANAAFGLLTLPESLPPERRSPTPVMLLNPASRLASVISTKHIRALLLAVFLLNLAFAGLLTNFPLFASSRFGWSVSDGAFFFAFAGGCAVLTQGVLIGRLQPRFGEVRLLLAGLALASSGLALVALADRGWTLYPVAGVLAVGVGLAIPSATSLLSRRAPAGEQGSLMGGLQAVLSLALIFGPPLAGVSFDHLGAGAPYLIGSSLAALALLVATVALSPGKPALPETENEPEQAATVQRSVSRT